ncbi:hypothetical protein SEUCBS140593_001558 [Sporothrix eucalyptigena]|uniref:Heterokaryon incompatibility domain-containing protein n=1 Tax=Sporothrix eucalyptigena TaxID=1812306 RepID=A0ABP0AZ80_9PEZI
MDEVSSSCRFQGLGTEETLRVGRENHSVTFTRDHPDEGTVRAAHHMACLDMWGPELPNFERDAIFYMFTPSWAGEARRRERIRGFLIEKLQIAFPAAKLPRELWAMIADEGLVRWYAVEAIREASENASSCSAELNRSQGIWAHYTFIEGVRYIERLTRAPPEDEGDVALSSNQKTWIKLLDGREALRKPMLYILEDHFGIRQLIFASPDDDMARVAASYTDEELDDTRNNMWWRTVRFNPWQNLRALSDDIKLRCILSVKPGKENWGYNSPSDTAWRWPKVPLSSTLGTVMSVNYTPTRERTRSDTFDTWYMESIILNEPDTTGYSALWDKSLVAFHTHHNGESDFSFYHDYDHLAPFGVWIYFPMQKNERIIHVFRRESYKESQMGLLFRTNCNRNWLMGPGLPLPSAYHQAGHHLWYHHQCQLPKDKPLRMFYNSTPVGIKKLQFEHGTTATLPSSRPVWLLKQPPSIMSDTECCASKVILDGIVRVTPSYKAAVMMPLLGTAAALEETPQTPRLFICGFLFEYNSGRAPVVLGEFRLDGAREPVDLTGLDDLSFGYRKEGYLHHIVQISTEQRDNEPHLEWTRVSLFGIVEMWYNSYYSRIFHLKGKRPDPEGDRRSNTAKGYGIVTGQV